MQFSIVWWKKAICIIIGLIVISQSAESKSTRTQRVLSRLFNAFGYDQNGETSFHDANRGKRREKDKSEMSGNSLSTCGSPAIQPDLKSSAALSRIVGGRVAVPHSWPWQCFLYNAAIPNQCGSVVLSERFILTAAHCVIDFINPPHEPSPTEAIYLFCGIHEQSEAIEMFQTHIQGEEETSRLREMRQVKKVTFHPAWNYSARSIDGDFALLELRENLVFNRYIQPVCLPAPGSTSVVTGWGHTVHAGNTSPVLKQVVIETVSREVCEDAWRRAMIAMNLTEGPITEDDTIISDNMLCAGDMERGAGGSCQGDSGGPLVIKQGGQGGHGIVSATPTWACAVQGLPSIYSHVVNNIKWIQDITGIPAVFRS